MIDLSTISDDELRNRGAFSTVRRAHEAEKRTLSQLCEQLMVIAQRINKCGQSDAEQDLEHASVMVGESSDIVNRISATLGHARSLASQRAELKKLAWK